MIVSNKTALYIASFQTKKYPKDSQSNLRAMRS